MGALLALLPQKGNEGEEQAGRKGDTSGECVQVHEKRGRVQPSPEAELTTPSRCHSEGYLLQNLPPPACRVAENV